MKYLLVFAIAAIGFDHTRQRITRSRLRHARLRATHPSMR